MDVRAINNYENDFCHGCLSFGRQCSMDSENASLFYQLLDPYNILKEPSNLILCWECEGTLKKIRIFQYKVNKAQALFQDVITQKIEHKSLSTLTRTTKNNYDHTINSETTTATKSTKLSKKDKCKRNLNKLKFANCINSNAPKKKFKFVSKNEDLKTNNHNYEIEIESQEKTENNFERNFRTEKYTVPKEENNAHESLDNLLIKQEGLKVNINKSEHFVVDIKQESDSYYSDDIFIADDIITTQEVKENGNETENLLQNTVNKKYKQTRVPRKRAKRTPIDYSNVDKYFYKIVLPPDDFRVQLNKWAKEKSFKASLYKCTTCALVFNNEAEQLSHKELHRNITDHRCEPCSLSFQSEAELISHGEAHEFLKCTICLFVCRTPNAREHLKVSHTRGYWQCEECPLSFRLITELTAHREKLHFTFICDYCHTKRNTKLNLQKHITANHMPLKAKCHLCERKFSQKRYLKLHLIDVHRVPGLSNASKESTYCVECNKQYSSMAKYRQHLRASIVHRPKKKIVVSCTECGKMFNRKAYLNNHYKLFHGAGTKHRCEPCNKYFGTGFALSRHITRVHKKIPDPKTKVCETCGVSFSSNFILIHHMRTHTGERPYECSHCDARFAQKYARDVHVRNRHLKHLQHFLT